MGQRSTVNAPPPGSELGGSLLPHSLLTLGQGGYNFLPRCLGPWIGMVILPPYLTLVLAHFGLTFKTPNPCNTSRMGASSRFRLQIPPAPHPKLRLPEVYDGVGSAVFTPCLFSHPDHSRSSSPPHSYASDNEEKLDEDGDIYDLADEDDFKDFENEFEADPNDGGNGEEYEVGNMTFTFGCTSQSGR
ncbi:hypothetical protein BDQ17DRAFT_1427747 [Cyathus striatus]|nr:hypothetical protein BDQ17DRAFT_1427747 [Cyathus striatus]